MWKNMMLTHDEITKKNILDNNSILGTEQILPIATIGQGYILKNTLRYSFNSIIDIGAGKGGASMYYASKGKKVIATGLNFDWYGDFSKKNLNIKVLEDLDI